ncbi:hypothetical protein L1987_30468 [Smallanthus sonchifolius]|uniref:Uncharacterized protein n=1 Tax=Smallanthus sonchifolius TaxID=185202 RepID=A0ACB9I3I8_9ASTR|nr:hypothetical protein L1987_30468 [Smallanthus sonchifolius]
MANRTLPILKQLLHRQHSPVSTPPHPDLALSHIRRSPPHPTPSRSGLISFQRRLSSHEFNTKSLRHFVEHVDSELNERLIPILTIAAANDTVLDLQDILQIFAFDTICKIAFGHDLNPGYLNTIVAASKIRSCF